MYSFMSWILALRPSIPICSYLLWLSMESICLSMSLILSFNCSFSYFLADWISWICYISYALFTLFLCFLWSISSANFYCSISCSCLIAVNSSWYRLTSLTSCSFWDPTLLTCYWERNTCFWRDSIKSSCSREIPSLISSVNLWSANASVSLFSSIVRIITSSEDVDFS